MRIVNKKEFLELPQGTLYMKYFSVGDTGSLCIKSASIKDFDWLYEDLSGLWTNETNNSEEFFKLMDKAEKDSSISFKQCFIGERDGMFNTEDMFVVYDKDDIRNLIEALNFLL